MKLSLVLSSVVLCALGVSSSSQDGLFEPALFFNPLVDIRFNLFTRKNPRNAQIITRSLDSVRRSNWNSANGIRIIIHGHDSGPDAEMNALIKTELLNKGDVNVVVVDWSAGSNTRVFGTARQRVGTTGVFIANVIDDWERGGLLSFNKVTLIGHNLGAHVAGNVGKNVVRGRIQAIFGLDPAGNGFQKSDSDRLSVNDAIYTEAIHTNSGGHGFAEPLTRVAFYPNWGSSQPGCGLVVTRDCSRDRAFHLYAESIRSKSFNARRCSGYQQIAARNCPGIGTGVMGGDVEKNLNGVFFLETNSVTPFARG